MKPFKDPLASAVLLGTTTIWTNQTTVNPPPGTVARATFAACRDLPPDRAELVAQLLANRSMICEQAHGLAPGADGQPNSVLAVNALADAVLYMLAPNVTPEQRNTMLPLINLITKTLS